MAPLTLLVGDNSTGKTSFLAALRSAWRTAYTPLGDGFNEPPCQLGSYADIVHSPLRRAGNVDSFEIGFEDSNGNTPVHVDLTFEARSNQPAVVNMRWRSGPAVIEHTFGKDGDLSVRAGLGERVFSVTPVAPSVRIPHYGPLLLSAVEREIAGLQIDDPGSSIFNPLITHFDPLRVPKREPFVSAPIRANPERTYNPARTAPDPWGTSVPTWLAEQNAKGGHVWGSLRDFGKVSGLFDELSIGRFGAGRDGPFQLRVRKYGRHRKGRARNLLDVGFGVSQALPIVAELVRLDGSNVVLLQQPEVHLHPSAQAALGSAAVCAAAAGKQIVLETHSDYLVNRVRLDVRDRRHALTPSDVRVLYFDHSDLDARIHALSLDEDGNIVDAPLGYRRFFADELARSLEY